MLNTVPFFPSEELFKKHKLVSLQKLLIVIICLQEFPGEPGTLFFFHDRSVIISNSMKLNIMYFFCFISMEKENTMTYEEFKRELYRNVSALGNCDNRQIKLLERGQLQPFCVKSAIEREEQLFPGNEQYFKGKRAKMVREDFLCVQWNKRNTEYPCTL